MNLFMSRIKYNASNIGLDFINFIILELYQYLLKIYVADYKRILRGLKRLQVIMSHTYVELPSLFCRIFIQVLEPCGRGKSSIF
jgi:hypothetical protein